MARVVAVETPFVIERQVVAPCGAGTLETKLLAAALHESIDRPSSLVATDVPTTLKGAVFEIVAEDDVRRARFVGAR